MSDCQQCFISHGRRSIRGGVPQTTVDEAKFSVTINGGKMLLCPTHKRALDKVLEMVKTPIEIQIEALEE